MKLKRNNNRLTLLALLLMAGVAVSAQPAVNMKFGKPTKEELEMTVYTPDSTADAVVLCRLTDVGYTVLPTGYIVDYKEKYRIKVLKPSGVKYANVVIPYIKEKFGKSNIKGSKFALRTSAIEIGTTNSYFDDATGSMMEDAAGNFNNESVEDVKAVAYNMENGKMVKSSLKSREVVREELDEQHFQAKFTIPDVKVGTVIEYEYTLHSQLFYLLHDWYAQCEIPVLYARLDLDIPKYLIFNVEEHGIQRLTCQCVQGTLRYKLESDALAAPVTVGTNHYICVGNQLKAMPKDSYVWNIQDHCAGITAELKSYSLRGTLPLDYAKNWEQIDQMILDDPDLGKHLNDRSPLSDELNAAKIADIADERERIAAVYQLVMNHVKWNGKYDMWPAPVSETLDKKTGTNADINLLLIQSMNAVGLNAAPVVLRTRTDGLLPHNFPSLRKLSSNVVGVTLTGGSVVCIDASSSNGYLNVLNEPLLVERARLVAKGKKSQLLNLQKLQKSQASTIINAKLSADGTLSGKQTTKYEGLAAAQYRQKAGISEFAPEANEEREFTLKGEVVDGKILVCPFPAPPITENPFMASSRLMPVEFPCIQTQRIVINIELPEGYTMETKPVNTIVSTPDKGLDGRFVTSVSDTKAHVQYVFNVNKLSHSEKNYTDLRQIFDMFMQYCNDKLVFKKTE